MEPRAQPLQKAHPSPTASVRLLGLGPDDLDGRARGIRSPRRLRRPGRDPLGRGRNLRRHLGPGRSAFGLDPGRADPRVLHEFPSGTLWLGIDGNGLVRFRDGVFTRIDRAGGLPSDLAQALWASPAGHLWIATENRGLARLDPATVDDSDGPTIAVVSRPQGLYSSGVHHMVDDGLGHLWMSSNQGVFRVSLAELEAVAEGELDRLESVAFTERDGMADRQANGGVQQTGLRDREGHLWFPTKAGVVRIDPRATAISSEAPPVRVATLELEQVVRERTARSSSRPSVCASSTASSPSSSPTSRTSCPLTLMLGPLRDALAGTFGPLGERLRPQIELAAGQAESQLGLVEQLLDVVRSDAGRLRLRPSHNDLARLVRRRVEVFLFLAEQQEIELSLEVPEGPVETVHDPVEIAKVVDNLLSNALKFTPRGGHVDVLVEEHDGGAKITVTDDGPGIAADQREQIFDRFDRGDTSGKPPGTGLGLALARQLAEMHRGRLELVTPENGDGPAGTCFAVTLPRYLDIEEDTVMDGEPATKSDFAEALLSSPSTAASCAPASTTCSPRAAVCSSASSCRCRAPWSS